MLKKIFGLTLMILTFSCMKNIDIDRNDFNRNYEIAKEKYQDEKYNNAIDDFNVLIYNYNGNSKIDSVRFYLAMSHFKIDEFYSASYEFAKLYENHPNSLLAEEALFKSALSYYELAPDVTLDQAESNAALTKFQRFLEIYKSGEYADKAKEYIVSLRSGFASKEFQAAKLYDKLEQPRAAKIYYRSIIENYYDTEYFIESIKGYAEACKLMGEQKVYEDYIKRYESMKKNAEK
ncbi:MAG: outer membrane protein assembly factor BamD [Candidatus Delongbacteria bacterium]|nr:outer membrane protein assembly factor BamD [Candidatus Delongbacteria bacterium]MBN2835442.1 outer membrane protein assembly factor BamD [Candidatus Delongbacteria bacterium]